MENNKIQITNVKVIRHFLRKSLDIGLLNNNMEGYEAFVKRDREK